MSSYIYRYINIIFDVLFLISYILPAIKYEIYIKKNIKPIIIKCFKFNILIHILYFFYTLLFSIIYNDFGKQWILHFFLDIFRHILGMLIINIPYLFGITTRKIMIDKGYTSKWFWCGFFLGIIGLIICLVKDNNASSSKITNESVARAIGNYALSYKNGAITKEEYIKKKNSLLSQQITSSGDEDKSKALLIYGKLYQANLLPKEDYKRIKEKLL